MKIFDKLQIKLFLVPRLMYFSKEFTKETALVPAKQGIKAFLFYYIILLICYVMYRIIHIVTL